MKRIVLLAVVIGSLAGCVTSPPRLANQNDAAVEFAKLGSGGKHIAQTFYDLGGGDACKRLYWAQRNLQQNPSMAEASPVEKLQRKYVQIPVPENVQPDGTIQEAHHAVVEVVQWYTGVTKSGKKIRVCD